jgi:dipeptidyl aminopeptidase/acylaminoacyl peptidase
LWTIPVSGGTSEPVAGVGENVFDLSVSPQDNRLVYAQISVDVNLWRIEIANPADSGRQNANPPTKIISSTRIEEQPQISPNGQRIAFRSNRSGSNEIWVSDSEGQNALQLTNFGGSFPNRPRWSPDGRFIAFNLNAGGNADIFVTSADGGSPRRLTTEATEETEPSWSRDGRYIYFSSKRTGRNEIWKMPAAGGEAVQVTREGGVISSESSDGRVLYYTKARIEEGLWTVSTEGGAETKVLDYRIGQNFAVVEQGIYFFSYPAGGRGPYTIEFFDFANRQTTRLATLTELAGPFAVTGITISPDQQWIVYAQRDKLDFDLMLVENFR